MDLLHKVVALCRCLIGIAFFIFGTWKLGDWKPEMHSLMVTKFAEYARVFPTTLLGLTPCPSADLYRETIGVIEVCCGLALIFGTTGLQRQACHVLMLIMVGALQTVVCNRDYDDILNPVVFFCGLLFVRYSLHAGKGTHIIH